MARIEIVAGMGTGKTSLANLLAAQGFDLVEEEFENNPFILDFYKDPNDCAFEWGVSITMQHYNQIRKAIDPSKDQVFDTSLLLNEAYAKTYRDIGIVTKSQAAAYLQVVRASREEIDAPDLRIYLKVSPETQKQRILKRGREYEDNVPVEFLKTLGDHVKDLVETEKSEVLTITIDSEKLDWVNCEADKQKVVDMVLKALKEPSDEFNKAADKKQSAVRQKAPRHRMER